MNLVKESLNEFGKGTDPLATMNLGNYKKVKDKLEEMFHDSNNPWQNPYNYKIIDLGHIEVFYNDTVKIDPRAKQIFSSNIDINQKWILKYIELPKYSLNQNKGSNRYYDRDLSYNDLSVYETKIYFSQNPDKNTITYTGIFDIGKYDDEKIQEMGKVIVDALNEKYEPVWGFELVEEIK